MIALTQQAASQASRMFRVRTVKKTYLAVIRGHCHFEQRIIDVPIGNDPNNRLGMAVDGLDAKVSYFSFLCK